MPTLLSNQSNQSGRVMAEEFENKEIGRLHPAVKADLHLHTNYSDGKLKPAELVAFASKRGIRMLAVTDHDNVNGVKEAIETANKINSRADVAKIAVIPGIEFSASWDMHGENVPGNESSPELEKIHIVGLCVDPEAESIVRVSEKHKSIRIRRVNEISDKLEECLGAKGLRREHLDEYINKCGSEFVTRKQIADYLCEQELVSDASEAFEKYLVKGRPAYAERHWSNISEIVQAIVESGGIPVLAHPCRYKNLSSPELIAKLIKDFASLCPRDPESSGVLSGAVEAGWPFQTIDDGIMIASLALENSLMCSMGSDFHEFGNRERILGEKLSVPSRVLPVWQDSRFDAYWQSLGIDPAEATLKKMHLIQTIVGPEI